MRLNLRKPSARRVLWVGLAAMFLGMAAYQLLGTNGMIALRRRLQEERSWQQRNAEMERSNEALQQRIHELKTNPAVIEKIAREEFMLAEPADRVILDPQKK